MKKRNLVLIVILALAAIAFIFYYNSHIYKFKATEGITSEQAGNMITRDEFNALDYGKQSDYIKSLAESDPAAAWKYLKSNFIFNGQVVGNVHEFAHLIGNVAYEKYGFAGVKICDESFAFGCFHGVTEKMLLTEGLIGIQPIEEGCLQAFPPDESQDYESCIHGIGHGVYTYDKGNLKKSLSDCDAVSVPNRQFCYDGVFMENSESPTANIINPKNPWKFCTDLDVKYHLNCARYQSQAFIANSNAKDGSPYSQAGKDCAAGPTSLLKDTCFESLGYYIAEGALGNANQILEGCGQMPTTEGKGICITGGATESVFQRYAGYADTVKQLCSTLSQARQAECETKANGPMTKIFTN